MSIVTSKVEWPVVTQQWEPQIVEPDSTATYQTPNFK